MMATGGHARACRPVLLIALVALVPLLFSPVSAAAPREAASASSASSSSSFSVVIYGGTPAGIGAALTIARSGNGKHSVLLIEPTAYIGGMAAPGGIGLRDHSDTTLLNSTELEWAMLNAEYYNVSYPVWQPDTAVGEASFYTLLRGAVNVTLKTELYLVEDGGVRVQDGRVQQIVLASAKDASDRLAVEADYFIDATYEGDLAAMAGATMTFGREAQSTYNESLGGITNSSIAQFDVRVNATWANGTLLPFIANGPDPRLHLGEADSNVMAYSFRACLTSNTSNQAPYTAPPGYTTEHFELSSRHIAAELAANRSLRLPWGNLGFSSYPPGNKLDACCGSGPVGIDAVGLEMGYVNGTRAERQAIYDRIRFYVQGLMYFWGADPRANVPAATRKSYAALGLCKDEWPDNGHYPPQLYVREARRLVGDVVFTQNDRINASVDVCRSDSIVLAHWGIDIHEMQRVAVKETGDTVPRVFNEGLTQPNTGGSFPYEVPYSTLLPKRAEAS